MSENETNSPSGNIIQYDPTQVVEIQVGDLTAPVAAGVEMSKLFLITQHVANELSKDIYRDPETQKLILPIELLPWIKEERMLLENINKMTKGIEEKAALKKMDIAGKLFAEYMKDLPPDEKIKIIRTLRSNDDRS